MREDPTVWAERILAGDRRAVARAISAVENGDESGVDVLKRIFPRAGRAEVVGITGSPGAGKSTLVEKLALEYRRAGLKLGIVAVDPTSPFSGGAILGDRIRMQGLSTDESVYIRSMATRGHLGGLAPAAHDVVTIFEAAGCQVVLIETVGVGQDEVDVARLADVTVLVLVPGMGDDIQTFKAGVMEVADLFVINKADRPGVERVEQELSAMLSITPRADRWKPPILKTVATSAEGIGALREAVGQFRTFGSENNLLLGRRREKWRARLLSMLRQRLFQKAVGHGLSEAAIESHVSAVVEGRTDPYSSVEEMIGRSGVKPVVAG